jgi:hypothetical protein
VDWLQTWDPTTVAYHRRYAGQRLGSTGSDQFPERDIRGGDRLFVAYVGDGITQLKGHLFLVARLVAAAADKNGRGWLTRAEAVRALGLHIWEAKGTVRARRGSDSRLDFDPEVPPSLLPNLTFLVRDGSGWDYSYLKLGSDLTLVPQTVRRVRRLDPPSARELEALLV